MAKKKVQYPDTMYVRIQDDGYPDCCDKVELIADPKTPTRIGIYELVRMVTVTPKFEVSE